MSSPITPAKELSPAVVWLYRWLTFDRDGDEGINVVMLVFEADFVNGDGEIGVPRKETAPMY